MTVACDYILQIVSETHDAEDKGGKVSYKYNLHGQMTEISGPGFTQCLYYTDGPGKKLYNGSVSAMTWTMGTDTRVRGYKYSYNGYGWLTAAEYGEHADLGTNTNRYTERFLDFMPNGGVRRLQRHGLKADGIYGKVDNLHISYDGNRITTVLEDADPVTQAGSMDYPGGKKELAFGYNGWGALVKDEGRGITDISYDRFGNPLKISYSDGAYTENVYSAAGEKLKATHATSLNGTVTGKTTIEYRGNVIYRDGKVDMVLFPGGYATVNGTAVTFHYYTQDYLGNNRAVINGSTGAIEQTTAYYPYGAVIADLGNPHGGQPYKFGGKELITANGLNEYDFGARKYYPVVPGFTKPDQMAEKYTWLSPYLYCANNPVNFVDFDGRDTYLWTTILPGPFGKIYKPATHSFITVTTKSGGRKVTSYFAYGSKNDGPFNWLSGQLVKCSYQQDLDLIKGDLSEEGIVKDKFLITPPEGMTQEEFDNKVKDVASSFGDQEKISYFLDTSYPLDGNCNSSTYTILKKAGVSEETLKELDKKIQGLHWGWGQLKPWTIEEQIRAIEEYPKFDFKNKRYEILQNALP